MIERHFAELYLAAKMVLVRRAEYGSDEFETLRNVVHAVPDELVDQMAGVLHAIASALEVSRNA